MSRCELLSDKQLAVLREISDYKLPAVICAMGTLEQLIQLNAHDSKAFHWWHVLQTAADKRNDMVIWMLTPNHCKEIAMCINKNSRHFTMYRRDICNVVIKNDNLELMHWLWNNWWETARSDYWFGVALQHGKFKMAREFMSRFPAINVVDIGHLSNIQPTKTAEINYDVLWGLLSHYSADQFWEPNVQEFCAKAFAEWAARAQPHRAHFMQHIAPHLLCPQN